MEKEDNMQGLKELEQIRKNLIDSLNIVDSAIEKNYPLKTNVYLNDYKMGIDSIEIENSTPTMKDILLVLSFKDNQTMQNVIEHLSDNVYNVVKIEILKGNEIHDRKMYLLKKKLETNIYYAWMSFYADEIKD